MEPKARNANSIAADACPVSPNADDAQGVVADSLFLNSEAIREPTAEVAVARQSSAIGPYVAGRLAPYSLAFGQQAALLLLAGTLSIAALLASLFSTGVEGYGAVPVESDGSPRLIVDVETAEWTDFALLPGVGRTLAHRMVEARDAAGDEVGPETFEAVRGVGPKTWHRIEPYLRFPDR